MSKKILAALLAVMMVFSMIPMTAFATEGEPAGTPTGSNLQSAAADNADILTGILEDTREDADGKIAQADLIDYNSYKVTVTAGTGDVTNVINVTGSDLRPHENADQTPTMGYWAGVAFRAPQNATGVSYKQSTTSASDVKTGLTPLGKLESNVTLEGAIKNGIAIYKDVTKVKKLYFAVQWTGEGLASGDGDVKVYEINFNVTPATPTITAAGYDDVAADAQTAINNAWKETKGADAVLDNQGMDKMSMWVTMKDLAPVANDEDAANYKLVVTHNGVNDQGQATATDITTKAAAQGSSPVGPGATFNTTSGYKAIWWTFNPEATGGTIASKDLAAGTYTIKLADKDGNVIAAAGSKEIEFGSVTFKNGEEEVAGGLKLQKIAATAQTVAAPAAPDTAPAGTETGAEFKGWKLHGNASAPLVAPAAEITLDATAAVYDAVWEVPSAETYTVKFVADADALATLTGTTTYEDKTEDTTVDEPTVTVGNPAKEFKGWSIKDADPVTLPAEGYTVSAEDAVEDADGNKVITLTAVVGDKVLVVPSIEAFGFAEDATAAVNGLNADIYEVRQDNQTTVDPSDVAPKTMWVVFDNLAEGTYKVNLSYNNGKTSVPVTTKNAEKIGPGGKEFAVTSAKPNPAIYWTFSQAAADAAGTVLNEDIKGTAYTVGLEKKQADGSFAEVKVGENALKASIEIAEIKFVNDKPTANTVVKDNFYQLGEDGTVAITLPDDPAAVEGFNFGGWVDAQGKAATTTFTKPAGNGGTVVTYTANWIKKAETGTITAGFNWKGDEGNTAIKTALTAASKDADVTDSLDQVYWMVINEDVVGKHYWKQVILQREGEADKVLMSKAYNPTAGAVGYEYNSFLHSAQNTIDATVKAGDKLVFNVYKSAEALTAKPTTGTPMTATVEVPANPFVIDEAEYVPATKTVTAKFNENLYGRYWIELTKQGETTPIAIVKTECNRATEDDGIDDNEGIMKDTGVALVSANALTSGTYTVSLYQRKSADDEKVGDAIATKEFKLDDSIATVEVYEGASETVSDRITATYVPATQEAAAKIELVGTIVNPENITVKLVAKDADGKEVGKVEGAVLTYDPEQNKFTTTAKLTTILGTEVAIDLTKLVAVATPVVEPTVSVTPPENADHLTEDEVKELTDTAASVQPTEEAKTVLTEKVTETVVEVDKDENYTPAAVLDDVKAALENTEVTAEEVTIVVQPYLHVEAKDLVTDESGAKTLKFDISAKYRVVATTADLSAPGAELVLTDEATAEKPANAVDVTKDTEDNELTVTESITLTIELPANFAAANSTVWVKHHDEHYHAGTVAGNGTTLTFTSSDGLSPFEISSNAAVVAKVGTTYYATLQEAIDVLGDNGGTIELVGNVTEKRVKVSGDSDKVITIVAGDKEFDPAIVVKGSSKAKLTREYDEATKTYTFTYKAPTGGGSTGPIGGGTTSANVTTSTVENGKITVSNSNATAGQQVTVTVKPEKDYYVVTGVTVTGSIAGNVSTTKVADDTYTFTMPNGTVKVDATIKHMYDVFTDIENEKAEKDYAEAIKWAVEANVTRGTDAENYSTFSPWAGCTRKEMVLFLYRRAGQPTVTDPVVNFTDISDAKYDVYRDAIKWAVANNITVGTGDGTTFSPDADCSRGEMVTFLYRFNKEPEVTGTNSFTDVESGEYYAVPVQWAVSNGITKGTNEEQTTFSPENVCHRVEMVTFLHRDAIK